MSLIVVGSDLICFAWRSKILISRFGVNAEVSDFQKIIMPDDKNSSKMRLKDMALSKDDLYLAVITYEKYVLLYNCMDLSLLKQYPLPRAASKVRFSPDSAKVLIADKTGDAYLYEWKNSNLISEKILSHLSLLLDVLISPDSKYVISCDRDEKIRVSRYPNTYNVQSYCLGHREFVCSIDILPHNENILISSSGDGTVRLWNYKIGKQLLVLNCNSLISDDKILISYIQDFEKEGIEVQSLPIRKQSSCKFDSNTSLLAITVLLWKCIVIYKIKCTDDHCEWEIFTEVAMDNLNVDFVLTSEGLWVYDFDAGTISEWSLKKPSLCKRVINLPVQDATSFESANMQEWHSDHNFQFLYKRKFDNVQEYQERKKQRLIQVDKN